MSERSCQRDHVREIMSERSCQREHVREIVSARMWQRERVREYFREHVRERQSHIVSESVTEIACQFHRVRAGSVSRVSAPVLTKFV